MAETVEIAIVGSGPGGLSAAGRAAAAGVSHVLLEATDHLSDTIYKYQKGKLVMATPDVLPLRSDFSFDIGIREDILGTWDDEAEKLAVSVRYGAEVTGISGEKGNFSLSLKSGEAVQAVHVVLAIGLQGNLRKLEIPGAEQDWVQYQLDDPDAYVDEAIMVIGAGDAAIENALGLATHNRVMIVNRRDEFARAKPANNQKIMGAIEDGQIQGIFNASPTNIEGNVVSLKTADGDERIEVDRIIARLGAIPPRNFVESCGVAFPSEDRAALPELSAKYESNVPGLYIIGALAGYPLIKQAMNQGYEVVEFIQGNNLKPADEPLLEELFAGVLQGRTVDEVIGQIQDSMPLLSGLTALQLREFLIDSTVHSPQPGDLVFERNDYTNSFFSIISGGVDVEIEENTKIPLGQGQFFGEIGLISGRRRTATVRANQPSFLIETPRRSMIKLINSVDAVKREMDKVAIGRQLQNIAPGLSQEALDRIVEDVEVVSFDRDEALMREGEDGDCMYYIRSGSVTVSKNIGGRDVVLAYTPAGNYVGEMALMSNAPRTATVKAAIRTEALRLGADGFREMTQQSPELAAQMSARFSGYSVEQAKADSSSEAGSVVEFLISQGVGEATDVLLIDESLCVRCDNCEDACAETHNGISRLDREAGPTFASVHVPTSCRHCEHPHCMTDCPPDAIHRNPNGEVYIDDSCIGCGNCQTNCPYGVIQMAAIPPKKPGLLQWLLFGNGPGPGQADDAWVQRKAKKRKEEPRKMAVKCDMCKDVAGGPACVRACPTGAAIRLSPVEFFAFSERARV